MTNERIDRRHLRLDQIDVADEPRDPARIRPLVYFRRRTDLRDPAAVHHGDAIGDHHRFILVVRDDDERRPQLRLQRLQLEPGLLAQFVVERRERLVEQQHLRPLGQRARKRDALALAAGQLVRLARARSRRAAPAPASRRPARRSRRFGSRPASARTPRCRRPSDAETARNSGTSCSPAAGTAARQRYPRRRAGCGLRSGVSKPASMPQQRGLAAAGRPEQREKLVLMISSDTPLDGGETAEALADLFKATSGRHAAR